MQASLSLKGGRVEFVVNGERIAPLLYSTSFLKEPQLRLFADCGVNLVSFPATADYHLYNLARPVWNGPDCYDYSELDANLDLICRTNPNAWIIPRVFTCSPEWWDAENPDELASGLVQSERERLCTVRAHCDRSLSDLDRLELGRSGRGGLSEE